MKWKTDWGLQGRMFLTMFLLFAVYLVFVVILGVYFDNILLMVVLMGAFSLGSTSSATGSRCGAWAPTR